MIAWKVVRKFRDSGRFYPFIAEGADVTYTVGRTTKALPAPLSIGIGIFLFRTRENAEAYLRDVRSLLEREAVILRVSVRSGDLLPDREIIGQYIPGYVLNDQGSLWRFYEKNMWSVVTPPKGTMMARSVRVLEEVGQ